MRTISKKTKTRPLERPRKLLLLVVGMVGFMICVSLSIMKNLAITMFFSSTPTIHELNFY